MPLASGKRRRLCSPTQSGDSTSRNQNTPFCILGARISVLRSTSLETGGLPRRVDRASQDFRQLRGRHDWVLAIALDRLTLGRANLALTLQSLPEQSVRPSPLARRSRDPPLIRLNEAIEGLRASGQNNHVPRGLSRARPFRRAIGDWDGATRDLDEAEEIAEPGPMRLSLCDCALERARLALAQREALRAAQWPRRAEPTAPVLPEPDAAAALSEEARKELDVARKLIDECGYHRRDEELAELDAVVAGARRFADLPPRV